MSLVGLSNCQSVKTKQDKLPQFTSQPNTLHMNEYEYIKYKSKYHK